MVDKIKVGRRAIEISHADKVLFPEDGITKRDLIGYYGKIAEVMLPYMRGRPVTMHRFPEGIDKEGFYQQEVSDYFPDWIGRVIVAKKEGGSTTHVVCQDKVTLIYMASQACITPHVWLSRQDKLDYPDLLIFDLDPPDDDFSLVRKAANWLRELLIELKVEPFVKTTGSRGVHIAVPLDKTASFHEVRSLARDIARILVKRQPDQLTDEQRKVKRGRRVFVDTLRNSYGQTAVAPYAVRARPGAPIATPIGWSELEDKDFNAQSYNISNIFGRMSQKKDPWDGIWRKTCSAGRVRKRLDEVMVKEKLRG
jgi:bifunctional non-homologous end joining protein LigD